MEVASLELGLLADRSAGPVDVAAMFDAEAASLTRLARFYVDDKTAAEDLVQEAFIRFARHHGRLRDPDRASGCAGGRCRHDTKPRRLWSRARLMTIERR